MQRLVDDAEDAAFVAHAPHHHGLSGGVWDWVGAIDLGAIGYVVAALFALTWAVAVAVWRFGRIEQRWAVRPGR